MKLKQNEILFHLNIQILKFRIQNQETLFVKKIRLYTSSLYMRHEIYATTFYGPLCLFGKKYEHKCIGPIYNECMKFGCGPFKGCQIYLTVL